MAYEYIADDKADDFQSLIALKELTLCMRGNFSMHFRCALLIFFKINFFKRVSNGLDPKYCRSH